MKLATLVLVLASAVPYGSKAAIALSSLVAPEPAAVHGPGGTRPPVPVPQPVVTDPLAPFSPTTPGSPPSGPSTGGGPQRPVTGGGVGFRKRPVTAGELSWAEWWELNRRAFFNLRSLYHDGGRYSLTGVAGDRPLRTDAADLESIRNALRSSLASDQALARSGLIALARLQGAGRDAELLKEATAMLKSLPETGKFDVLVALAILGDPATSELAAAIARNTPAGRRAVHQPVAVAEELRAVACLALARSAGTDAIDSLIEVFEKSSHKQVDLQSACVLALGLLQHELGATPRINRLLLQHLENEELKPMTRSQIPHALALSGDNAAVSLLAQATDSAHPAKVRRSAVIALGKIGMPLDQDICDLLEDLVLKDRDAATRHFAIMALAERAYREARPKDQLSAEENACLNDVADLLYHGMSGRRGQTTDRPWFTLASSILARKHQNHVLRIQAELSRTIKHEAAGDNQVALIGMGLLGSPNAAAHVRHVLDHSKDRRLVGYALEALAMLGEPEVLPRLMAMLEAETSDWMLSRVSAAMSYVAERSSLAAMVRQLKTAQSARVQALMAMALGDIGDSSTVEPLVGIVANHRLETHRRARAAAALGVLGQATDQNWIWPLQRGYNLTAVPPMMEELLYVY